MMCLTSLPILLIALTGTGLFHERALLRERQEVRVRGQVEAWELRWRQPPELVCIQAALVWDDACQGFSYAQRGDLVLVRIRNGHEIDRLNLSQYFARREEDSPGEPRRAMLQLWEPVYNDFSDISRPPYHELIRIMRQHHPVTAMQVHDYDGDGEATEFVLQIESNERYIEPSILIGVDRRTGKLKPYGRSESPSKPLVLRAPSLWDAVREQTAKTALHARVTEWRCDGLNMDKESVVSLRFTQRGVHFHRTTRPCQ